MPRHRLVALLVFGFLANSLAFAADRIICAGGEEVFVTDAVPSGPLVKHWSWNADHAKDIPAEQKKLFRNLDEVKPVEDGKKILLCASNSGCALIDYKTKAVLWSTTARNAHSIELLPNDRVAVASSLGGNELLLYKLKGPASDKPIWRTPLHSAHGLVWDDKRQSLWAIGFDELREYQPLDWQGDQPGLKLKATHKLPDDDGHDLRPVPNSQDLVLTTEKKVFLFDRASGQFRQHSKTGSLAKVKAFDIHPKSGQIVYSLWAKSVQFLQPTSTLSTEPNIVYKVRWFPER